MKSYVILFRRHEIINAVGSLKRIYIQNEKATGEYIDTLEICSSRVLLVTKILSTLYSMCFVVFCGWPVISYVVFGRVEAAVPICLPFLDINTNFGFMVNATYHTYILILATCGLIFCDLTYVGLVFHVQMMSGLFAKHWAFISERLRMGNATSCEVKFLFRNLCRMHKEIST